MGSSQSTVTSAPGAVVGGIAQGAAAPVVGASPFGGKGDGDNKRDADTGGLFGGSGFTQADRTGFLGAQREVLAGQSGLLAGQGTLLSGQAALGQTLDRGFQGLAAGQAGLLSQGQATQALLSQSTAALGDLSATTTAGFAGTRDLIGTATLGTRALVSESTGLLNAGQQGIAGGVRALSMTTDGLASEVGSLQTMLLVGGGLAAAAFLYSQQEGQAE